ncbi:DUF6443 domain-containing protein [Chitinophagaceae bacterium LB-8]|uniref:DUF6443 domain-containing protein n=1 Tax=Paraflavisolibacter caeni TaxID=2982496 RepID=A0A9X2XYT2_9BACT|nr:DUF6443 domain-containing protein [Paraflavisolibacter caeni]MCU7551147.1 DUF6443 domain-containing protein [Paraflavisolibacter caeni]
MQHKTAIKRLLISLSFLLAFSKSGFSQVYMGGPTCVQAGVENLYYLTGNYSYSDYIQWCVYGGTSANGNQCESGYGLNYLMIKFTTSGQITVYTPNGAAFLNVTVTDALNSGSISSNGSQTITYNYTPGTISCSAASGGGCYPSYAYQWEQSTNGTNWSSLSGKTAENLSFSSGLTQTTYYRRMVTETSTGTVGYSNVATVYVNPQLTGGSISPESQSIYSGGTPGGYGGYGASGGGCGGSYNYQWQYSDNGTTFYDISGANGFYYSPPGPISATRYYRRKVTCGPEVAYTNTAVVNVYPALQPGGVIPSPQYINYNTTASTLSSTGVAGGNGSYTYQWQSSADGVNYTNISGANSTAYDPGLLTATKYYRLAVTSLGTTAYSSSAVVNVYPPLQAGSISPASTAINYGTSPGTLSSTGVTGGNGSYAYQWQSSSDGANFTNISGATASTYMPGSLTSNTYYRVFVTSNAVSAYSSIASVTVYPAVVGGSISPASQTLNLNNTPTTLSISGVTGGSGTYTYQWQKASNSSFTDVSNIAGATVATYTPPTSVSGTLYYRVMVSSNGASAYSSTAVVTVYPDLQPGSVSPISQNLNLNSPATPLTLSGVTGGNGSYTYQWQQSSSSSFTSPTNITGANTTTYTPPSDMSGTLFYRVAVSSNGVTAYSSIASVTVYAALQGGSVSPASQNVHYNGTTVTLVSGGVTGGSGTYTYQWQQSSTSSFTSPVNIEGATGSSYTPPANVVGTTYYRVVVSSNGLSANSLSAVVTVSPPLQPGSIVPNEYTIVPNTSPGHLAANGASQGGCAGAYAYQWEQSSNGIIFTSITGATGLSYEVGNLSNTTWYRRKAVCGVETAYTNACKIIIGTVEAENLNYIKVREFMRGGITDAQTADGISDVREVKQATQYLDGLGRLVQTVTKQGSNGGKDVVKPTVYDPFGREAVQYLPFVSTTGDGKFKVNPLGELNNFYKVQTPEESFYYGQTEFEASPLNRVNKITTPGDSWTGSNRGIATQHWTNTLADEVRMWSVTDVVGDFGTYTCSLSPYPAGELYKTVTEDEHGKQVIEFKDKEGRVILKKVQLLETFNSAAVKDDGSGRGYGGWLSTYYIYDDLGQLRAVLQPKAVEKLNEENSWSSLATKTTMLEELTFRYEYDARGRMILKKVPGAAAVQMVYDVRDRLVMSQDGNMRKSGQEKWMVTFYDELNRPVKTGLWQNAQDGDYHRGQAMANTSSFTPYPFSAEPTSGWELLTETHYDGDYSGLPAGLNGSLQNVYGSYLDYSLVPSDYAEPLVQSSRTKGLVSWTKVKVLGESKYLYSVNIYDEKGRVIQVQATNISDGIDIVTTRYDFAGKVLRSHIKHQKGGAAVQNFEVATKNNYDDLGRITTIEKNVNASGWKQITSMEYDALGQLKSKKLAPAYNGNNGLETLDYAYNIRGWLLGVNREFAKNANQNDRYFGFDLGYDKKAIATASAQVVGNYAKDAFNGNIAGSVWRSIGDGERRKYDYDYDAANRLLKADFTQHNGTDFVSNATIDFSVKMGNGSDPVSAYDANGNIKRMQQWGLKGVSKAQIDDLTYNYTFDGHELRNKLYGVSDAFNDKDSKLGDFKYDAATKGTTDYDYDQNGNLTLDANKSINSITYNHLNLPSLITTAKGTITYTYDAGGNKLKKVVAETGKPAKTTLYLLGTYEDDVLQFLPQEEGRIRYKADNGSFVYDYFIKDHLGNVRMVLTEEQQTNFYPAATLEGSMTLGDKSMIGWEKEFFSIDDNQIRTRSQISSWSGSLDYSNNNGNPPYNSIASGSYPSNYTVSDGAVSDRLYRVNGSTNKTGLAMAVKVMAGDVLNIHGKSYYNATDNFNNSNSTTLALRDILDAFLNTPGNVAVGKGVTAPQLEGVNTGLIPSSFIRGNNGENSNTPKAYINYILLDEQFRYMGGGFSRVGGSGAVKNHWFSDAALQNIAVEKNGYLYVYVSNESNVDVFFDNLQVIHTRGPVLEETHYYPFGLTMAGISSKAMGMLENRRKFNDGTELESKEFSDGTGLELYATEFRSYDPQIGRFHQMDELADDYEDWSPYVFAYDNPISYNDPLGLFSTDPTKPPETSTPEKPKELPAVVVVGTRPKPSNQPAVILPTPSPSPRPEVVPANSGVKNTNNSNEDIIKGAIAVSLTQPETYPFLIPAAATGGAVLVGYSLYNYSQSETHPTYQPNWFSLRDNTNYVPPRVFDIKGERNQTGRADGTNNPFKKLKPDPKKPGNVLEKNSHTGKEVSKPAPPGFFEWWNNKKR